MTGVDPDGTPPSGGPDHGGSAPRAGARRRRVTAVVAGALVVLAVVVWALVGRPEVADEAEPVSSASSSEAGPSAAPPTPDPSATGDASPVPPAAAPPAGSAPDAQAPAGEPTVAGTAPPVALDAPADFGTGVAAEVVQLEAVTGEAQGLGEVAGPAVRVTLVVRNGSPDAVPLNRALVDVLSGPDAAPAPPLSGPGLQPFSGSVPPGGEATGVYVFAVPADQRDDVRVTLSYVPEVPTVVFEGAAPRP